MSVAVDQPAQLAPTESVDVPLAADVDHPAVGVDAPETDTATEDSVPAPEDGVTDVLTEVLKLKKAVEALPVANGAVEDNEVVEPAAASEPEVRLYSPHATPRHAMYASPCPCSGRERARRRRGGQRVCAQGRERRRRYVCFAYAHRVVR